ncbi:bestrophin family protein [Maribacter ulvicola]|uniref:Putative membrane protein n=1 Tax=Maribacter ulvicola TaxID=228959 RepID=A0A1N6QSW2_9FLAO|nr:bestrophin family ion channel [Maribacter ulvicola]SIQ19683.1 putative membrane protein [Maribacter ulvicola]
MIAKKRLSFLQTLKWSRRYLLLFLVLDAIPIATYHFTGLEWISISWQPISLIGIAVSFYLGFKNNASYDRLWEARKVWGAIVNTSRSLTVMTRDFISNKYTDTELTEQELIKIRKVIVHRHVAWLRALAIQLRTKKDWEDNEPSEEYNELESKMHQENSPFISLKEYLTQSEFDYITTKGNKASHILSLQSKHLKSLQEKGLLDNYRYVAAQDLITDLYTQQGKCERIKNFPFPRQYSSAYYYFVIIFIILVPFGMIDSFLSTKADDLIWFAVPFSAIVSWIFWTMEKIGENSENPFTGSINDVPISSLARSIEIDIRQMLDEENLPNQIEPIGERKVLF